MGAYEQLNVRRRKFVDAYLALGIGSQAVIAAGYTARGHASSSCGGAGRWFVVRTRRIGSHGENLSPPYLPHRDRHRPWCRRRLI